MVYLDDRELVKGIFISRENRFVAIIEIKGHLLRCHLPNPGRMRELLIPYKSPVYVNLITSSNRKTQGTIIAVKFENKIINLDTIIVSKWMVNEFQDQSIPSLENWSVLRTEKQIGKHRYDLILLDAKKKEVIVELKSTTLVRNGIGCFPDAVSSRATSQVKELSTLQQNGRNCMIIFLVQRQAKAFETCSDIDPKFSQAFIKAMENQVRCLAIQSEARLQKNQHKKDTYFLELSIVSLLPINSI